MLLKYIILKEKIMYNKNIEKIPEEITRCEFVTIIFDLGLSYEFGYDTLMAAVQLGDKYIDYQNNNYYSQELAHMCTVVISKFNEDYYYSTSDAIDTIENSYMLKLEWDLFTMINYVVKIDNVMTYIGRLVNDEIKLELILGQIFWYLCKDICMNKQLLLMKHETLLRGCMILHTHNKLKAVHDYKKEFFNTLSSHYDLTC